MRTKNVALTSFDGTERQAGLLARAERQRDVVGLFAGAHTQTVIARGSGLSYSAASMADGVVSLDMTHLDRVLSFDAATGDVVVEAGITVGVLTDFLAARGFSLPVVPGYPRVTAGGCVAFDVHGKSQWHAGNFGEWVTELQLIHPDRGEVTCSPTKDAALFELTIGGMGLTGVITRVALRTKPLAGKAIEIEVASVDGLEHAAEVMAARAGEVDCLYSWHDVNKPAGRGFGAGMVFLERYVDKTPANAQPKKVRRAIETRFPVPLWNRLTAGVALPLYRRLQSPGQTRVSALRPALFPIEGLEGYYAAFGRRGFREYQLIVPTAAWPTFVGQLKETLGKISIAVTLCSLKLFKGAGRYLAFRGTGICLAIDVPAGAASLALFAELDRLAILHGCCVNLSKDSRLSADTCGRIFPQYQAFREELQRHDARRRLGSRLRERIGV